MTRFWIWAWKAWCTMRGIDPLEHAINCQLKRDGYSREAELRELLGARREQS